MSTFGSFEIGRKALRVQHKGMEVSGQNVANANTPGYTRQRTDMESVVPPLVSRPSMAPGQGVVISDVVRIRSEFYHAQMVSTTSQKDYWEMRQETYLGLEAVLMEPNEYSINSYLGEFFDAWQELSASPEDSAVRAGLRETSVSLTRSVQDTYMRLEELRVDLKYELEMRVNDINRITDAIAEYNDKLRFIDALQQKSNELHDKLDLAIEELAELVDIRVHRKENGTVEIFSGGRLLVQEDRALHVSIDSSRGDRDLQIVSDRGKTLNISRGRVKGLLDAVNRDITSVQDELDRTIETLINDVNRLHSSGYGLNNVNQYNFFEPPVSPNIAVSLQFEVSGDIIQDSSNIAASSQPWEAGNGSTALEIARLRDLRQVNRLDGYSITEYYRGLVTSMGAEAQDCARMKEAFERTLNQVSELHQSIAGVNIDEEMLNMVQFQHSWNAAARYLSTVDEMLTVLFSELGR